MRRGSAVIAGSLAVLLLVLAGLTVAGFVARSWMPPAASQHGVGVDHVIRYLMWTTGAVFVLGHLVLATFVWRYGSRATAASPSTSARAERLWSILPVLGMTAMAEAGVFVMALPVWSEVYKPVPEDAVTVEVTAKQFEWIARYPGRDGAFGPTDLARVDGTENPAGLDERDPSARDDLVFVNEIHVPVGRPVFVRLRSRDVLHSFSIPAFRTKQDVVPGLCLGTLFTPTVEGRYEIACAELCGLGHYRMRGFIVVQSEEDYAAWLASQRGWFE